MMRTVRFSLCALALSAFVVMTTGCSDSGSQDGPTQVSGEPPAGGHDDHDDHDDDHEGHGHEEEHHGPHDGHVIELGRNHEYHAELVENEEAGMVTVYILDKDLKELAINQQSIVMNLMVDNQPKTFELASAGGGNGSRFDAADRTLFEALHEHEATGKLSVTINGSPYSGEVEHHHHDEDDDDHEHGEHGHK